MDVPKSSALRFSERMSRKWWKDLEVHRDEIVHRPVETVVEMGILDSRHSLLWGLEDAQF